MFNDEQHTPMVDLIQQRELRTREVKQAGVALLAEDGTIAYIDQSWLQNIGLYTNCAPMRAIGEDYLALVDALFDPGASYLQALAHGLRAVLRGEHDYIEVEFPYAYDRRWRWFVVQISPSSAQDKGGALVRQYEIIEATHPLYGGTSTHTLHS